MADYRRHYGEGTTWSPRERDGYWRHYEGLNDPGLNYAGRGLTDFRYQRSHDRIRISDCMVKDVSNRLRATREPNGHHWTAGSSRASGPGTSSRLVTRASGKGTPSKSSDNSA